MDMMEKIERLRAKANVTYEEARDILTETEGDLLEAFIRLEKQGKLDPPRLASSVGDQYQGTDYGTRGKSSDSRGLIRWIKGLIAKANRNSLQIRRNGNIIGAMPVTIFVAALLFAFWVAAPLLVIGLFCGCSYSFSGPDLDKENINKAWDKASQVAETIKEDIKKEIGK